MSKPPRDVYLGSALAPLRPYLDAPQVTDIYINHPGEVWVERLGAKPERIASPELTAELLQRLVEQVAAANAMGISRAYPLLAATLPDGARIQVAMPPITRADIAIAIRKHAIAGLRLEDYEAGEAFADTIIPPGDALLQRRPPPDTSARPVDMLRRAVQEKRNILVSGGTASGKTTFLNTLLSEVPAGERLVLIEDTPELQISHANAIGLIAPRGRLAEADISTDDLVSAALRMRPDRIILGEIRGSEALSFLRAVNTGHPGSLSSIHADSPLRAIDQLALLVMQTGTRMEWSDVVAYVRRSLDLVVQLEHVGGRRRIAQIQPVV